MAFDNLLQYRSLGPGKDRNREDVGSILLYFKNKHFFYVFAVLAANKLITDLEGAYHEVNRKFLPQVLVIAPTREIASQNHSVLKRICPPDSSIGLFVGGTSLTDDFKVLRKGCRIAVGTCGRITQLIQRGNLRTHHISILILDEADKLMEDSVSDHINYIFSSLPEQGLQVMVLSATYPHNLDQTLCDYMRDPILIRVSNAGFDDDGVQLIGVKQYTIYVPNSDPLHILLKILNNVQFIQCIIFNNDFDKCKKAYTDLTPSVQDMSILAGELTHQQRTKALKDLQLARIRVLVATDVAARGIDAPNVNLVVNFGCPLSVESYIHRTGRAGRFGTTGAVITVLPSLNQYQRLQNLVADGKLNIKRLTLDSLSGDIFEDDFFKQAPDISAILKNEDTHSLSNSAKSSSGSVLSSTDDEIDSDLGGYGGESRRASRHCKSRKNIDLTDELLLKHQLEFLGLLQNDKKTNIIEEDAIKDQPTIDVDSPFSPKTSNWDDYMSHQLGFLECPHIDRFPESARRQFEKRTKSVELDFVYTREFLCQIQNGKTLEQWEQFFSQNYPDLKLNTFFPELKTKEAKHFCLNQRVCGEEDVSTEKTNSDNAISNIILDMPYRKVKTYKEYVAQYKRCLALSK